MNERELAEHLEGRTDLGDVNGEAQTPEEETAAETPAQAETVSEEQAQPDPVQEYINKYGGDTNAALRAAVEAQSLIGRQGSELGAVRQEIQELRGILQPAQEEPQFVPVDDTLVSWAQEIGSSTNFHEGADWALQHQPAIYQSIMEQAYAVDPMAASRYEMSKGLQAQQQQLMAQLQPVLQPVVQQRMSDEFGSAWMRVKSTTPDLDQFTPQLLQAAEQTPEILTVLQSGTPEAKERVIRSLYHMAKGMNAAPLEGAAQQAAAQDAAGAAALRQLAAVGTTTNSAPSAPSGDTGPLADWRADFREAAGLPALDA